MEGGKEGGGVKLQTQMLWSRAILAVLSHCCRPPCLQGTA